MGRWTRCVWGRGPWGGIHFVWYINYRNIPYISAMPVAVRAMAPWDFQGPLRSECRQIRMSRTLVVRNSSS